MDKIKRLNKRVYKKIKFSLLEKNFSQKEVAERADMSASYFCRCLKSLEEGKSILTETIFKIAGALEIEPADLFK